AAVIFPLMLIMQFFRELGWIDIVSKVFSPFTRFLGMQKNISFTLVTGRVIGLALGAGVMIQAGKEDGGSKKDSMWALICLVNCTHVIDDTVIILSRGIPVLRLLSIRFVTAVLLTVVIATIWSRVEMRKRKVILHEHRDNII